MPYRSRATLVEAFRFERNTERPAWFRKAIAEGRIWYQGGDAPYYTIMTPGKIAHLGDWIVRRGKDLLMFENDEFNRVFELTSMSREEALASIKTLRDHINDTPDDDPWVNQVVHHLDQASDVIEFGMKEKKNEDQSTRDS